MELKRQTPSWLEKAVFYEIYPQTFYDSNNDGIGDIPGITQKLDYIRSLGADAIWLNPCFESPFGDAGYDVSDFYKVAPRYGTNADLKSLFEEARKRGIRVILDLVAGHTSTEHPWFKASCKHERNPYSDWYIWNNSVWAPTPPGYESVRGYAERDATYITNFFHFQPALNYGFAHPDPNYPWQQPVDAPGPQAVRREMKAIMKFWLDMGCSGFRVDMASSLVKGDPDFQEVGRFWQEIRAWFDREYPDACLIAEWSCPAKAVPAGFHIDFYIHFGVNGYTSLFRKPFTFNKGNDPYGASFFDRLGHGNIREFIDEYQKHYDASKAFGFISLPSGNHDIYPRISYQRDLEDLKLVYLFLMTLPGIPFIYYGDEIGMRTIEGLPSKEGGYVRTAVRTPMQWDDSKNAGFSTAPAGQLYLPVDPEADRPTVAGQQDDSQSLLNLVRGLVQLRKQHPALGATGDFEVIYAEAGRYPFVYKRSCGDETLLVVVNPSGHPVEICLDKEGLINQKPETVYGYPNPFARQDNRWMISLPGASGGVYRL